MAGRSDEQSVEQHYTPGDLIARVTAALQAAGKDLDALTPDDLAALDQFHTRGKVSTLELARLAGIGAGMQVLDVGGGLGGPARMVAEQFGAHITVLDLTEEFVQTGVWLTDKVGLSDRVTFRHGSALDLPFPDASFDVVWTQHASMNIADKQRLFAEIYRVLRPGGRFALHDIMAGAVQPVYFPVPWARDPATSFLGVPEELRALITATGFREIDWIDETSIATSWFQQRLASAPASSTAAPGLNLLLGADFAPMMQNQVRNLNEGRITVFQGVFERPQSN